jgi:hypothetical protein
MERGASILVQSYQELPLIDELKVFMHKHKLHNLEQLLQYNAPELLNMEGFGFRCLFNLYSVLKENRCEEMLREKN